MNTRRIHFSVNHFGPVALIHFFIILYRFGLDTSLDIQRRAAICCMRKPLSATTA